MTYNLRDVNEPCVTFGVIPDREHALFIIIALKNFLGRSPAKVVPKLEKESQLKPNANGRVVTLFEALERAFHHRGGISGPAPAALLSDTELIIRVDRKILTVASTELSKV